MKLKKIYTGFTKDGKDRLLQYKEHYFFDYDTFRFVYQDLLTKEIFETHEIKEESLIPFVNLIKKNKKLMVKKRIIDLYKNDRNISLNTADLVVGNIYQKTVNDIDNACMLLEEDFEFDIQDLGNYVFEKRGVDYVNLLTGEKYTTKDITVFLFDGFVNKVKYVDHIEKISDLKDETSITKKKVLEKYYNK